MIKGYSEEAFGGNYGLSRAELLKMLYNMNIEPKENNQQIEFTDVSGHWAENEIKLYSQSGFIVGYEDKTFKPNKLVTRAEFAVIIARIIGENNILQDVKFDDVSKDYWAYDYIKNACLKE